MKDNKKDNKKVVSENMIQENSNTILDLLKKLGEKDKEIAELHKNVKPVINQNNNITINYLYLSPNVSYTV